MNPDKTPFTLFPEGKIDGLGGGTARHPGPLPRGRWDRWIDPRPRGRVQKQVFPLRLTSVLLLAISLVLPPAHAGLPDSMELTYKASWGGIEIGTLKKVLRKDKGSSYVITGQVRATGLAALLLHDVYDEESRFTIDGDTIFPQSYRLGPRNKPKKLRVATFDWERKVVRLNNDRSYPLKPGIQDAATFPLWWMIEPPGENEKGQVSIVDGKRLSTFQYTARGIQEIETPAGKVRALLVERRKPGETKKVFRIWLDVNRSHLAIRLENVRPNNTMVFELTEASGI